MFKLVLEKIEEPEIKLPISAISSKEQESSRKDRGTRDQIAISAISSKEQESSRKTSISVLLTI